MSKMHNGNDRNLDEIIIPQQILVHVVEMKVSILNQIILKGRPNK